VTSVHLGHRNQHTPVFSLVHGIVRPCPPDFLAWPMATKHPVHLVWHNGLARLGWPHSVDWPRGSLDEGVYKEPIRVANPNRPLLLSCIIARLHAH
jgi:hypothetical protein